MADFPKFTPDTVLSAEHDGEGWLIRADIPGRKPFFFGGYAETAKDAHWAAGECAKGGCRLAPLRLN